MHDEKEVEKSSEMILTPPDSEDWKTIMLSSADPHSIPDSESSSSSSFEIDICESVAALAKSRDITESILRKYLGKFDIIDLITLFLRINHLVEAIYQLFEVIQQFPSALKTPQSFGVCVAQTVMYLRKFVYEYCSFP